MQEIERLGRFDIILIITLSLCCGNTFSQIYPNPVVDSLLETGITETIDQNYSEAKSTFIQLDKLFPELPLGKIYITNVYIAQAFDYSCEFQTDTIDYYLGAARKEAENLVNKNDKNIWNQYSLALCEGIYSYFQALNNNWISAFTNGLNSISGFQECLKLNTNFYDAYTALGTYKYWRSRKTQIVKWLPFVPDEEDDGIKYLSMAIDHSTYTKYMAVNSLIWIYIDRKNFSNAEKLALIALKRFPDSRQFKLEYARALEESNPNKAIQVYSDVLNDYLKIKGLNHCNEILNIKNLSDYEKDKLGKRIERVKQLKENIEDESSK